MKKMKKMKRGGKPEGLVVDGQVGLPSPSSILPVIAAMCLGFGVIGGLGALLIWLGNKESADNKLKNDQLKKNSSSKP